MSDLEIRAPETAADHDAIRALCWEYRAFLLTLPTETRALVRKVYARDGYAALLDRLEELHTPPQGVLRLALLDGTPVGCGMAHTLTPGTAEIKRVYLRDEARGKGAGFALMQALIAGCREQGFARIVMDTGHELTAAKALYLSMGFRLRGPYQQMPPEAEGHLVFFEMDL